MDNYKKEMLDKLTMWASDNKAQAKEWLKNSTELDETDQVEKLEEYGVSDQLTGNDNGSFYCSTYKAKQALTENDALTDEGFLYYIADMGCSLDELFMKGWETVDVSYRDYVLHNHLTAEEILEALKIGVNPSKELDIHYFLTAIYDLLGKNDEYTPREKLDTAISESIDDYCVDAQGDITKIMFYGKGGETYELTMRKVYQA